MLLGSTGNPACATSRYAVEIANAWRTHDIVLFASAFRTAGLRPAHLTSPFAFIFFEPKFKNAGQRPAYINQRVRSHPSLRTHDATINLRHRRHFHGAFRRTYATQTKCSPSPKLNPCAPPTRSST